jgi:hypothetical protein
VKHWKSFPENFSAPAMDLTLRSAGVERERCDDRPPERETEYHGTMAEQ